jgi:hypothetical protein
VVKFALAHPDICAPLLRSPSRRTVSAGCPSKFVSLETKALAKALLSHAIGTTESASSLWTRKVLPVWQERLGWTDGPTVATVDAMGRKLMSGNRAPTWDKLMELVGMCGWPVPLPLSAKTPMSIGSRMRSRHRGL